MVQGQVFLKGGVGVGTFPLQFFQGLSFSHLHLEITLSFAELCSAFEEKNIFFLLP